LKLFLADGLFETASLLCKFPSVTEA